jgi:hypothetical protein
VKKKTPKMTQQLVMEMLRYMLALREPLVRWMLSWAWKTVKYIEPQEFVFRMGCMVQALVKTHNLGEGDGPASSSGLHRGLPEIPTTKEGLAILTNAIAEIADSGVVRESDDDDAWLEEGTETPEERYRGYVQSEQCEVSDPDERADVHYGHLRSRSRSRETTPGTTPDRPIPKLCRNLLQKDENAVLQIKQLKRWYNKQNENEKDEEYAKFFNQQDQGQQPCLLERQYQLLPRLPCRSKLLWHGLVPRERSAFEDYRWDLIMQGLGPETVLVDNCRELSHYLVDCRDLVERSRLQRLLRNLQALLVMFQSKEPQLWIDAAYHVRGWLDAGRGWSLFEEGSTIQGSRHEEGEEEERDDDDDIYPQDRVYYTMVVEMEEILAMASTMSRSWDYDG